MGAGEEAQVIRASLQGPELILRGDLTHSLENNDGREDLLVLFQG
jgi:hypothetical protein